MELYYVAPCKLVVDMNLTKMWISIYIYVECRIKYLDEVMTADYSHKVNNFIGVLKFIEVCVKQDIKEFQIRNKTFLFYSKEENINILWNSKYSSLFL